MLGKFPRARGNWGLWETVSRSLGSEVCGYLGKSILRDGKKCRILDRGGKALQSFKQNSNII